MRVKGTDTKVDTPETMTSHFPHSGISGCQLSGEPTQAVIAAPHIAPAILVRMLHNCVQWCSSSIHCRRIRSILVKSFGKPCTGITKRGKATSGGRYHGLLSALDNRQQSISCFQGHILDDDFVAVIDLV